MQYYRSSITGLIVSDNFSKSLAYIFGPNAVQKYVEDGVLIPIEAPTVNECIRHGSGSVAVVRYRELNPDCSWPEASEAVRKIKIAMKQQRKKAIAEA